MNLPGLQLLVAVGVVAVAGGCVPMQRAEPPMEARFELLWERDLSRFEQRLATERQTGNFDAWTRVGEAWLELANCRPVVATSFPPGQDRAAAFVHATLVLEDVRRRLRIAQGEDVKGSTLAEKMQGADFFEREPGELPSDQIRWPSEDEEWPDEVPAPMEVEGNCEKLAKQVDASSPPPEAFDEEAEIPREQTIHAWRLELFEALDRVVRRYRGLDEERRTGSLAAAERLARYYGAALAHRLGEVYRDEVTFPESVTDAMKTQLTPEVLRARALDYLGDLVGGESIVGLDDRQTSRVHLLYALVEERAGHLEEARRHLARADTGALSSFNQWSARYLRLRLLAQAAEWGEAASITDSLPPRDSRYYEAFAFRAAQALRQNDEEDRFLKVAKQVFRHRRPRSHPYLRALYSEVLASLVEYRFEGRVVELLEELGSRSGIYTRVEDYARRSLDRGRTENARAAARWLLDRHQDARYRPRYYGLLALAAFLEDDREGFRQHIREVASRPETLTDAISSRTRARMFAHADAEMARILRETLPLMAEWGNSPRAERRRKQWLEIVVEETQRFLRQTEATMARDSLVELYRLASSLLEQHPRGYAERVGDEEPAPLVLGSVRLGVGNLEKHEPAVVFRFPEPYSLLLVPRDADEPPEWPRSWPEEVADA